MSRIVAVLGGGNWADASVEHIEVPEDMDLDKMKDEYNKWFWGEYCPHRGSVGYLRFTDWLVSKHSVKWADIEEYEAI